MNGLLKLHIVQDCPHLPIAVTSPVRSDYLNCGVTNILPRKHGADYQESMCKFLFLLAPAPSTGWNIWQVCLSPHSSESCFISLWFLLQLRFISHLLQCSLQYIPTEQMSKRMAFIWWLNDVIYQKMYERWIQFSFQIWSGRAFYVDNLSK